MEHSKLVGAVSNCAVSTYPGTYAVRLQTAPTGGESVHLFLEFTINEDKKNNSVICYRHQRGGKPRLPYVSRKIGITDLNT